MDYIFTPKNANKYYCKICDFQCSKQSDWNRHILTRKHNKSYAGVTNDDNITQQNAKSEYVCECGNTYKYRQGLYKHKKICSIIQPEETVNNNTISTTDIDKELLMKMLLKNQDIIEGILFKNSDVMNKMLEVMPQISVLLN